MSSLVTEIRRSAGACFALALLTALVGSSAVADAAGLPRGISPTERPQSKLAVGDSRTTIDVKFAEGTDVRLRANRLVSQRAGRLAALDRALARFPGVRLERVFAPPRRASWRRRAAWRVRAPGVNRLT